MNATTNAEFNKISGGFELKNYGKASPFSSFLPGVAGIKGVPIWSFYVNRGQGIVSFGVDNKDHAIMEFSPAHQSYQNVKRTGFRTFILKDGVYTEAFYDECKEHTMRIFKNTLEIEENDTEKGIKTQITYFVLPEETVGALVRKVTVTNTAEKEASFEILDGMPALIPYGVSLANMKNMTQTAKAWMQVEDSETGLGYYRVRASIEDTTEVSSIAGGNFAVSVDEEGSRLKLYVDPESIFDYDCAFEKPVRFAEGGIDAVEQEKQNISNLLPCAFFGQKVNLKPQESHTIYELIGQVESKDVMDAFMQKAFTKEYFDKKKATATALIEELCQKIETKTGNPVFDEYCKYTYMDNLLRGGYPMKLGNNKIYYVYSRKHGDIERDYNYFSILPEYYSQGNGNFRDVNQNRRCDGFFSPFVGRENIHLFYSLIQLDGYNPLSIEKLTYKVDANKARSIVTMVEKNVQQELFDFITKYFTPGKLYRKLEQLSGNNKSQSTTEELFNTIIDFSNGNVNGNFGEGYWSDHWTYNLDLIEEYIALYPEKEEEMLNEQAYSYFLSQVNVNRRSKRYVKTDKGIRQYHCLDEAGKRNTEEKLVRDKFQSGKVVYSSLLEKLILMCTVKFAALDAYGMGIEMEGGKPGWYDALNGMPGMLGSSMAETYELARMLEYTIKVLKKYTGSILILKETACLLDELFLINHLEEGHIKNDMEIISFWNKINDAKEIYREKTYQGISGEKKEYKRESICEMLESFLQTVERGIEKAAGYGDGICPTYFTYDVTEFEEDCEGIHPKHFEVQMVPYFLEGPVRYLKLPISGEKKKELYMSVKNSDLYDKKLSMYKVNASLNSGSFELGRARAFTPGWLENESIWLHMEYKYLLELLKAEMYEEFAKDFYKAAVPFLEPEIYGRSTLENSSFIASSNNPNAKIHGKGFVARLSGSTVEFLSIWRRMMFGKQPFNLRDGELTAEFAPMLPGYLLNHGKTVSARFMGECMVTYHLSEVRDYFPGNYQISHMEICYKNGVKARVEGGVLTGQLAKNLRDGKVHSVEVFVF